jgi:hypothetical protein
MSNLIIFAVWIAVFLSTSETRGQPALLQPLDSLGRYSFAPNQLAAAQWYKPAGHLINGHIAESFGNTRNWPGVRRFLHDTRGAFGINAAEIGYLESSWLLQLREMEIGLSAEVPAWTQCAPGKELAQLELFGAGSAAKDPFDSIFGIRSTQERSNPRGHGWFFTKDQKAYIPDEILLDHRIPFLLPRFDNEILLRANPSLSWQSRKDIARRDPCPSADRFHDPATDRVSGALIDYVDYAKTVANKFSHKPAISFHWNVNPAWEWNDEQCLDSLHDLYPEATSFERAFREVTKPCHRDTAILARLIATLCAAEGCPSTVFMDVDLTYQTNYTLDVLRRNKDVLSQHAVGFGIDLTDECNERVSCIQFSSEPGKMRLGQKTTTDMKSNNILNQQSLMNKLSFLVDNGIIDKNTYVRLEGWSSRPVERADETAELTRGSFANTMTLMQKFISQRNWGASMQIP